MIGRDDPIPIGLALDAATDLPHRFETAEMGFGEALAGGGIVLQMGVDRVAPAIGGGDLGDGMIDRAHPAAARRDLDDGVFRDRLDRFAFADFGIMGAARSEEHTSELPSLMRISY